MNVRGSSRLTLFYHAVTAALLSFLLLPGVFGSFIVSDTELGLPLMLLVVILVQLITLGWYDRKVGSTFNPKDVPTETYIRRGLFAFASIFAIHLAIVLFGAPIFDSIIETFLLSCFVASLTTWPLAWLTDCSTATLDRLFFKRKIDHVMERSLVYVVICTLMGCWLGALPIPLDWDQPWQRWPLTCVMSTVGGAVAGHVAHAGKTIMSGRPESSVIQKGKTLRA